MSSCIWIEHPADRCGGLLGQAVERSREVGLGGKAAGDGGSVEPLEDLQWADWDAEGRLLVATRSARLQVRRLAGPRTTLEFEADLAALAPSPAPAPEWAQRW